jgi:hypothetical protein
MALSNVNVHALAVAPQAIMTRVQKGMAVLSSGGAKNNLRSVASAIAGFSYPAPGSVLPGGRNQFLARAAGHLSHKAKTPSDLPEILGLVNQTYCNPPVDEAEVESVARSIGSYMPSGSAPSAGVTSLADGEITIASAPRVPRATLWGDMLFPGKYSVLAGPGGTSKTILAIGLGVHVCLGQSWADLPVAQGASLLFLGEEDSDEIHRRVNAVLAPFAANEQAQVKRLMRSIPAAGKGIQLVKLVQNTPVQTEFTGKVIAMSKELEEQAEAPVKLIVFDHARLVGAGDSNDGSHVTELTRVLTHIAQETGAAVVLIGHSPKSIHGKTEGELSQSDVVGSGAYVDNARSTLLMTTLSDSECKKFGIQADVRSNYARLQVVKNNHGRTGTLLYFHRRYDPTWQVAPLDLVKLSQASKAPAASIELKIAQDVAILKQLMSKSSYCERRSGANGPVGIGEKQLRMHVERMLMRGQLQERKPTEAERIQHRLSHNIRSVLVPGTLSGDRCPDELFDTDGTGQKT